MSSTEDLPELSAEDLAILAGGAYLKPVGELSWKGLTPLYNSTKMFFEQLEPKDQAALDQVITEYIDAIRQGGVDTENEHDMMVFAIGVNIMFSTAFIMLKESQCPDFEHVWDHFLQAAHRVSLAIINIRNGFGG
jgi:hypothetical protein